MRARSTSSLVLVTSLLLSGCLGQAREAFPPSHAADAAFNHAQTLLQEGHLDEAEQQFLAMTVRWTEHASPWTNLGYIYRQQARREEALVAFRRAVFIDPGDCLAWMHIASVHGEQFAFRDAERALLQCLEASPTHPAAWLNLGVLYELRLGELTRARSAYERYQSVRPDNNMPVARWIADLTRRIEQSQHLAGGVP